MYQRRTNKKDEGVSPVVGVMLMLVVTIVIAGVVALFATGVVGDLKTTPMVSAGISMNPLNNTATIDFYSLSEPISLKDLQLSASCTTNDGYYIQDPDSIPLGYSGAATTGTSVTIDLALKNAESSTQEGTVVANLEDLTEKDDKWKTYFSRYAKQLNYPADESFTVYDGAGNILREKVSKTDPELSDMIKYNHSGSKYHYYFFACKPGYNLRKSNGDIVKYQVKELKSGEKVDFKLLYLPTNTVVFSKSIVIGA